MEPVGIERDRVIGKLKGYNGCIRWSPTLSDGIKIPICELVNEIRLPCKNCNGSKYSPYSTDIVYAMELLREIRESGRTIVITFEGRGVIININGAIFSPVETLPDAISKAWLTCMGALDG